MKENRQHRRFAVENIDINCRMVFANKVTVNNLCLSGISLQGYRRFEIGREYALKVGYEDRSLSFKGAVVWSVLSGNERFYGNVGPIYKAGLKLTVASLDKLQGFIDMLGSQKQRSSEFDSAHKPGSHLFAPRKSQPASPERTILDVNVYYKIKRVSLNNLLVESEKEIAIGTRLPIAISLPENMAVSFIGKVVYCLKGATVAMTSYNIGIEYTDMSSDLKEKLKMLIHFLKDKGEASSLVVRSSGARLHAHDMLIH